MKDSKPLFYDAWKFMTQDERLVWFDGFASALDYFGVWGGGGQLIGSAMLPVTDVLRIEWKALFPGCSGWPCKGCEGCHGKEPRVIA